MYPCYFIYDLPIYLKYADLFKYNSTDIFTFMLFDYKCKEKNIPIKKVKSSRKIVKSALFFEIM